MSLIFDLAPANAVLPVVAVADPGGGLGEYVAVVGNDIPDPPKPKLAPDYAGVLGPDIPPPPPQK